MAKTIKIKESEILNFLKQKLNEKKSLKKRIVEEKEKIELPDSCFGGPKTSLGGMVLFASILEREASKGDLNSEKLLSDMKTFLKGVTKVNPEMMARLLKKYNKENYMPWVGCF